MPSQLTCCRCEGCWDKLSESDWQQEQLWCRGNWQVFYALRPIPMTPRVIWDQQRQHSQQAMCIPFTTGACLAGTVYLALFLRHKTPPGILCDKHIMCTAHGCRAAAACRLGCSC
jgi:hypothetical protein